MQEYQFAAERSGASSADLEKGLGRLARTVDEVVIGKVSEGADAFARLGDDVVQAAKDGATLDELLPLIADKFAKVTDPIEKASVAQQLFGKSGRQLIPLLNEGSKGIEKLREEARKYGVISTETAMKSEEMVDAQRNLDQSLTSLKSLIATELMPQFTDVINGLADWISENDELIAQDIEGFIDGAIAAGKKFVPVLAFIRDGIKGVAKAIEDANNFLNDIAPKLPKGKGGFLNFLVPGAGLGEKSDIDKAREGVSAFLAERKKVREMVESLGSLDHVFENLSKTTEKSEKETVKFGGTLDKTTKAVDEAEKALEALEKANESFGQTIEDQIADYQKQIDLFGATTEEIIKYEAKALRLRVAQEGLNAEWLTAIDRLEGVRLGLDRLERIDALKEKFSQFFPFEKSKEDFEDFGEVAEKELTAVDVFASDVASNINSSFADALEALVFDFDKLEDAWKSALRSMANAFFQLLTTVLTNPIRIGLEASLSGAGGAGAVGGGAGGIGSILGGLGGAGGLFGSSGSFTALGALFTGNSAVGFGATLGAAIPAIGIIVAAAAIAIPLISKLFEKKPKLDVDIGVIRDDMGKRAALVSEFLDPALIDDVINISQKRKAGLGVGGNDAIKDLISKSITGSIEAIQSIIAKLPEDLFESLNNILLNAEVDIESKIKGDKLLEFDETKKIAEKFQAFIEGDLPARFFASIRDSFFAPALESLGVSSEATQDMMDNFLASLKGASREERAQLGQEFLATFDAYVDVFNLLNDGIKGVFGQAIDQIKAVSKSLEIESATGIPTLAEIEAGLQNLFETGMLTAETAQQFLALRQSVIELNVGLARSVSNISSIISQLDSDIVGLGGSAIGSTAGIEEAIDRLQGLLDNEGLSLDEREAILNELNSLTNQLSAAELEKAQAGIQANIDSTNSQIQNLERLKTVEAEKNQASLDALNAELALTEELEGLLESISRNISSLLLAPGGPESVFERIARARGGIDDLFAQLASAAPEDRAGIASQIQDLVNQLDELRKEAFQAPSAESDDLFREVIGNLEKLEGLVEPARSSEEIQASIEDIERASQEFLSSIDSQISSFQSKLTTLQSSGNQLTGEVAERVRELKESIRAEFVEILDARLEQLGEVSATGLQDVTEVSEEHLIVLRDSAATLETIAGSTSQMAAALGGLGVGSSLNSGGFLPGLRNAGFIPSDGIQPSGSGGNVSLTLPPVTFNPNQVVNPDMFMSELMKRLHDRRVVDEIAKALGVKK